jgi:Ca-activated chloride channel homolog
VHLAQPAWLWLSVLMPLPWLLGRARPRIAWPSLSGFPSRHRIGWFWLRALPAILRGLAIGALAVALARPQTVGGTTRIAGQGVAIVVALDNSSSMNAVDFPTDRGTRLISRLDAAKSTFGDFVAGRSDDLIGLVVFANYSDLACSPTLDHGHLRVTIETLRSARPGDDGTNIGDAMAVGMEAVLAVSPTKKVLVLLTDGNNEPAVPQPLDPEQAALLARAFHVTLYTIAIGRVDNLTQGLDPSVKLALSADVAGPNLALLERLVTLAGGRSFVASSADTLTEVFRKIDALEKSPVQGQILTRYNEHFAPWAGLAVSLLFIERLLSFARLRRLP